MYVRSTEKMNEYRTYFDKKTGKELNMGCFRACKVKLLYNRG